MTDKIVVLTAVDSQEHAAAIARALVEKRLAACVNILPGAQSVYRWKGVVEEASEWILIIKSRRDLYGELEVELRRLHSYEVPECIALPVVDGSADYLAWLDREIIQP
jgi:periplasmic divalent cation tolerance protein